MKIFTSNDWKKYLILGSVLILGLVLAGCAAGLFPQMTFQGRLTDSSGNPINGNVTMRFSYFHQSSGGTAFYNENRTVAVNDGLFNAVMGPSTAVGGLTPEDLSEPIWVELRISNGVVTETLTPRQRLYGAPYAFTLMPGAVISASLDTTVAGTALDSVVTVRNSYDGDASNLALPALRAEGEASMMLSSPTRPASGWMGSIYSQSGDAVSDLGFFTNDDLDIHLDVDKNSLGYIQVFNEDNVRVCYIDESGNLVCSGTKSAAVEVDQAQRKLYAIESPEVWFEDFGRAQLDNGSVVVNIDELFAATVNLGADYHVFLTPLGDCQGLYVAQKTPTGFEVRELGGGTASVEFDYRIVAKRAGYEAQRLELVAPENGSEEAN